MPGGLKFLGGGKMADDDVLAALIEMGFPPQQWFEMRSVTQAVAIVYVYHTVMKL